MRVLVTGGPGFFGTHAVKALLRRSHQARVLDNPDPHVYPDDGSCRRLAPRVECIIADVLNPDNLALALCDADAIAHLAALTVNPNMEGVRSSIDLIEKVLLERRRKFI